jgi:hypothetical protein
VLNESDHAGRERDGALDIPPTVLPPARAGEASRSNHHQEQDRTQPGKLYSSFSFRRFQMAKTYRTPVVASLGAAEVMTGASLTVGKFPEPNHPNLLTTVNIIDL